jgi:anti-sigma factor (TIGR02949 family)
MNTCEHTLRYLDSYVSNELTVETNHELLQHLESCPACSAELEARSRLRTRLRAAVSSQNAPPDLQVRIREQIRRHESRGWAGAAWTGWAMATAASLLLCAAVWFGYSRDRLPALTDRPAQNAYIQKISATLATVLKAGLGDHIHCAIFRKYPQNPPTVEHMAKDLGPAFEGLLPLVKSAVPGDYRVVMGHQCTYSGRKFIHLTLQNGGELVSLVIAVKQPGESLAALIPSMETSGIPIYQSAASRYQVAGFEAGQYLAFVVSELREKNNLHIAANLAPQVHEFLTKKQG